MPKETTTKLNEARSEYEALAGDLPKLEALLEKHDQAFRQAKLDGAEMAQLVDVRAKRDAVASMVEQHRADIAEAQQALSEVEGVAQNEEALAEVAAGTVKFREAEAAWYRLMDEAEEAVRRAVTLSAYLARIASQARGRAANAAGQIVARAGEDPQSQDLLEAQLARAVAGSDVAPLSRRDTTPPVWASHPFGGRYRALHKLNIKAGGVSAPVEDPAQATGVE